MESYTPDQAAILIGASASTVRNWCKTYARQLSAGANPPRGTERRLTTDDVAKLQRVKGWRDDRVPAQEIERLLQAAASAGEMTHITIDAAPAAPQNAQEGHSGDLLLPVVLSSIERRQDSTDARLNDLQQMVAMLERKQTSRVNGLITGIVIGAGLMLVAVAWALGMVPNP